MDPNRLIKSRPHRKSNSEVKSASTQKIFVYFFSGQPCSFDVKFRENRADALTKNGKTKQRGCFIGFFPWEVSRKTLSSDLMHHQRVLKGKFVVC